MHGTHVDWLFDGKRSGKEHAQRMSQSTEFEGLVLCAGLGTRLRPATENTPKPGVPFMGRPIAMHSFAALARAGITNVGANVHYLPTAMLAALEPLGGAGFDFHPVEEKGAIQGTAGGVREILKDMPGDGPVVICHGDVVFGVDLAEVVAAHKASNASVTLVLKVRDGSTSLRGAFTDASGRVVKLIKATAPNIIEPLVEHAFTGIQIVEREVLELIPEEGEYCMVTQLYPRILEAGGTINAFISTAYYADLGTYPRYLSAQRDVFDAPSRLPGLDWPNQTDHEVYVGPEVRVEEGATIIGPVRLEGEVHVKSGAVIGPYVSASGRIDFGAESRVTDAAVWGEGTVNSEVRSTLCPVG